MSTPAKIEQVAALPRRVAQVTHALIESQIAADMPVSASEVCIYDADALSVGATSSALQRAREHGLALCLGRYWTPSHTALELRRAFEDRVLAERDADDS